MYFLTLKKFSKKFSNKSGAGSGNQFRPRMLPPRPEGPSLGAAGLAGGLEAGQLSGRTPHQRMGRTEDSRIFFPVGAANTSPNFGVCRSRGTWGYTAGCGRREACACAAKVKMHSPVRAAGPQYNVRKRFASLLRLHLYLHHPTPVPFIIIEAKRGVFSFLILLYMFFYTFRHAGEYQRVPKHFNHEHDKQTRTLKNIPLPPIKNSVASRVRKG